MIVKNYFPTSIFTDSLAPDRAAALNSRLLAAIRSERARDPHGTPKSTYRQLGSWHSHTKLHKEPEYAEILDIIQTYGAFVSQVNGYDPRYALRVTTMWSIINPPGASMWSGVYYIQTPLNAGSISFIDPRTANVMQEPRYDKERPREDDTRTKITILPEAGKIVIFPSWLYHAVAPNMAEGQDDGADRVIISFNFNQKLIENKNV
jgi:uncharacterized protein (TIGR02466 family)